MAKHKGSCNWEQAKRGNFEVCSRPGCTERFPCAGNDCGHSDCILARGELPKCHYCLKRVEGNKGETWTSWAIHGLTRAVHYTCRDNAKLDDEPATEQTQSVPQKGNKEATA